MKDTIQAGDLVKYNYLGEANEGIDGFLGIAIDAERLSGHCHVRWFDKRAAAAISQPSNVGLHNTKYLIKVA
jgi:hypothetical protein